MNKATRVRYKLVENVYVSTQSFLGNDGTLLKVKVNTDTPTVTLVKESSEGDEIIVTKPADSIAKCKTLGKVLLKEYGVNFFEEARKRIVS